MARGLALLALWASLVVMVSSGRVIRPVEEAVCKSMKGSERREFVTPPIRLRPGDVSNLFFFVEAPAGRFATRDFIAEMVLEDKETPVPLFETYLHHWLMYEYAIPKTDRDKHKANLMEELRRNPRDAAKSKVQHTKKTLKEYPGAPDTWFLIQQFGVGAETRHTDTKMPIPYGFEGGDRFGEDYDSVWILNVHAIDTRGAVDRWACTECRCSMFNYTSAKPLPDTYHGGLACCHDAARCHVKEEFLQDEEALARNLRMRYTWSWTEWDGCVEPLTNVRLDVTQIGDGEKLEYEVDGCESNDPNDEACVDTKISYQRSPVSGSLISSVGHFHATSISATIWGEDGTLLCQSLPIYGTGHVVGNEAGYVVGITACWPPKAGEPYQITEGEMLKFEVKYSKVNGPHTGLMGLINLKIATGREDKSV